MAPGLRRVPAVAGVSFDSAMPSLREGMAALRMTGFYEAGRALCTSLQFFLPCWTAEGGRPHVKSFGGFPALPQVIEACFEKACSNKTTRAGHPRLE
jgi:hypothetical protein